MAHNKIIDVTSGFALRPLVVLVGAAILSACGGGGTSVTVNNPSEQSPVNASTGGSTPSSPDSTTPDGSSSVIAEGDANKLLRTQLGSRVKSDCVSGTVPIPAAVSGGSALGVTPNTPPAGQYIYTAGGEGGVTGKGGDGGCVIVYQPGGMGGLVIDDGGQATPSVTPTNVAGLANTGAVELTATSDLTVDVVTGEPAANTYYMVAGDSHIYKSDGDGALAGATPKVTGISVAEGATLKLKSGDVSLTNDIDNKGKITTVAAGTGLSLLVSSYYGATTSSIDTHSASGAGGDVVVVADYSIYNAGSVNATGAGNGGAVTFDAQKRIENSGAITTSGGDSTGAAGGNAGAITLKTYMGKLVNSGALTAKGGKGWSLGGNGGAVNVDAQHFGGTQNSGTINAQGGDASVGAAGNGGDITIKAHGGELASSGALVAKGGSSGGNASGANGGAGGNVLVAVLWGMNMASAGMVPAGDLTISGNIDAAGGNAHAGGAGAGGNGGDVEIDLDAKLHSLGQQLTLLGYQTIDSHGGDGVVGGKGGSVGVKTDFGDTAAEFLTVSSNITNKANIVAKGGNSKGRVGAGGAGGNVALESEYYCGMFDVVFKPILPGKEFEHVMNEGGINTSGGEGANGAKAGDVWVYGSTSAENTGAIQASGGAANGTGGDGGNVDLLSDLGLVSNAAAVSGNGGAGTSKGGKGAVVNLTGLTVANSAGLAANGGNAGAGGVGGAGGLVELYSPSGPDGVTAGGPLSAAGGTGGTAGATGGVAVGGVCKQGVCGK